MNCDLLAHTGSTFPIVLLVIIGLICVITGAVLTLHARRRRTTRPVVLLGFMLLVLTMAVMVLPAPTAQASTLTCTDTNASVQVSQTSTLDALVPGIEPIPITGFITNTGSKSLQVMAVEVSITSVTTAQPNTGSCDATDYVLLHAHMPVNEVLTKGQSLAFTGASIGFNNKTTVQDACKNATVHLLYTLFSRDE